MELTNQEKIEIVEQHLKNVLLSEYNINLTIEEATAIAEPIEANVSALNLQLADILAQKAALNSELAKLQTN